MNTTRESSETRARLLLATFRVTTLVPVEELTQREHRMIRSVFTDPMIDSSTNYNIEHFNADGLSKHIMNMYLIRRYPKLRNCKGIQIMQTMNEKFRASRSWLCSYMGLMDLADLSYDTASQRIKVDTAMSYMFDAAVSVVYTIVESRFPGKGDAVLLDFYTLCNRSLNTRIDYDFLVSSQLKLLRLVKCNDLRHVYTVKPAASSVNAINYREGSLDVYDSSGKRIYSATTRAIDEKLTKNKLAQDCIDALTARGWSLSVPPAYSANSCTVWWW
ncbi:31.3 kDa RNAseIII-like [Spodoptera frugiperda ascovirus 1a]|uniref:31.3 kDa RNAseIII-like n=1 Tax=Spodoptera frugiperda ascovirus 1a TaxID=113370 RepID=Q0E578_SFAVA|nr:31.3 kDa RNAseIII-like [Spodoptera frugiperda ascovirus 1a]CAL44623.1 31.3 kDa RNAseIII-like [Spodoptera frugiperda ascovirus 1a]